MKPIDPETTRTRSHDHAKGTIHEYQQVTYTFGTLSLTINTLPKISQANATEPDFEPYT